MYDDARGHAVTLTNPAALEAYERALHAFQTYRGDPLQPLDEAIAHRPRLRRRLCDQGAAPVHDLRAPLHARRARRARRSGRTGARSAPRRASARWPTRRASSRTATGTPASRALERVLVDHPRDILALQVAHLMDFFRGDALNLRNRVSRVLPAWSRLDAGLRLRARHARLRPGGVQPVSRGRAQRPPRARALRRRLLGGARRGARDGDAGPHRRGHRVARRDAPRYWAGEDNGFAFHNCWHLALFHMDRGDFARRARDLRRALRAGGTRSRCRASTPPRSSGACRLEGVDVGARFAPIADAWERALDDEGGFYAFNDFHAALAFAGGRPARRARRACASAARGRRMRGAAPTAT